MSKPELPPWVNEKLASIGSFNAEAAFGRYTYAFPELPELVTDWCRFTLEIFLPYDPTTDAVDAVLARWEWYRPRHAADSAIFRSALLNLYRACDDFLPRDLPDSDILKQVTRGRIEIAPPSVLDFELHAEVFAEFAGEHAPLLAWDDSNQSWEQIA